MSTEDRYARYTRLSFDRPHPKVLRITMANGKMNAADHGMHAELGAIWRDIDADPTVNAAIITGAGKMFSAGGDFAMIEDMIADFDVRARTWKEARDIVYNIINCSKPVVSAMRGVAVGAGLVCGLLADISIATKDCRILDGHTRLGVAGGDHAAIVWPLLCGMARAKYYLLLCEQMLGAEAERIGLGEPGRGGWRVGGKVGRGGYAPGRGCAERDTLDQIRAQQLAAAGRPDLRHVAGTGIHGLCRTRGERGRRVVPGEAPAKLPSRLAGLDCAPPR